MKSAIILHGMPSKKEYYNPDSPSQSNKHWLPWLQKEFIRKEILAQTPEMPEPYKPDFAKWSSVFEQFSLSPESILIGHSCGGGFLVRWLSENKVDVAKVVLVAPWIDLEKSLPNGMFDFKIDPTLVDRVSAGLTILGSDNDDQTILDSIKAVRAVLPNSAYREFSGYGHFCYNDLKSDAFPELLQEALTR
jgi:predicted alpha/beta hydrolase family esterase